MITAENEGMNGLIHKQAAMDKNSIPDEDAAAPSFWDVLTFYLTYIAAAKSTDYKTQARRKRCPHPDSFQTGKSFTAL